MTDEAELGLEKEGIWGGAVCGALGENTETNPRAKDCGLKAGGEPPPNPQQQDRVGDGGVLSQACLSALASASDAE